VNSRYQTLAALVLIAGASYLLAQQPKQTQKKGQAANNPSVIQIMDTKDMSTRVVLKTPLHFEAPNWSPDGKYLLLNSRGKLWKLAVEGGEPAAVDSGAVTRLNNDHGISRDGKWFAISAGNVYILPSTGGEPKQITNTTPSYFHTWDPDGKSIIMCAQRNNNFDLYRVPVDGGDEVRLTVSPGYDDGPDYSPDGKWIYFNSDRSGSWDIWRIPPAGGGPDDKNAEQITKDEFEDWFPHISPDGKKMVLISFPKGTQGHPPNQNVMLRMIPINHGKPEVAKIKVIAQLFGGQGTMNVNSWSPDSRYFAFVSYDPAPAQ
jgi:Tol biopolymer transport system component